MSFVDSLPLYTAHLTLRVPSFEDLNALAAMHADPGVTRFLTPWTRDQAAYFLGRIIQKLELGGHDFVAMEESATGEFVGLAGLLTMSPRFLVPLGEAGPLVEVGYRLTRRHWGKGYATEAAEALMQLAFDGLKLPMLTAIANVLNEPSNHILRKVGLKFVRTFRHDADDIHFYRLERDEYRPTV